jgi:hypothetical protein
MLQRRESYAQCSQHWHKFADFDGNVRMPGPPTSVPMFASAPAPFLVPLAQRYPRAQYPLAKLIVNAFSALLFGEDRCPALKYPGDDDASDYAAALVLACDLWPKMIQARNWGGGCGTVGISWSFHAGKPRIEIHRAKHLVVHEWLDRQELVPAKISEVYTYPYEEWDAEKRRFVQNWYWYHRYWDTDRDVLFEPCPVREHGKVVEPTWVPAEVIEHNDGAAHFVWVQNIPSDEIDGLPDYDGQTDDFDDLDIVYSVLTRGTVLNLDPTLVLKMDPAKLQTREVAKGSDNALRVGADGDAKYLELAGTSVTAGLALFNEKKKAILEVAQCVLADPNEVAAAGISSVALKVIYAPMLSAGNVLRGTYGKAVAQLVSQMMRVARDRSDEEIVKLPPRVVSDVDSTTGEKNEKLVERVPGVSEDLDLQWPAYFQATATDRTAEIATLSTATGAKQIISTQTANEEAAKTYGRDPAEEWKRLQSEQQAEHEMAANAFGDADAGGRTTELTKKLPGEGELKILSSGTAEPKPVPFAGATGAPGGVLGGQGGGMSKGAFTGNVGAQRAGSAGGVDGEEPPIGKLKGPKLSSEAD